MTSANFSKGYMRCGLPYNRLGRGPKPLVVFQGLMFENKPQPALMPGMYHFLGADYTIYVVLRKPGLPKAYTLSDMASDYAAMIREEFGDAPLDVIGVSTGGSIGQVFAADHPALVRKLVIHSSAYTLSAEARSLQMQVARLAQARRWREAYAVLMETVMPRDGMWAWLSAPLAAAASGLAALSAPKDANDLVVTIEAEDVFDFKDRLSEITASTLVAAGDKDPFYTPDLFRETAEGIPNARLALYPGVGHPAGGKQFARDVLEFFRE